MQTQREELLAQLVEHGWRVAREVQEIEWWADEMWQLESVWSPVGTVAYVTFLVDPQWNSDRNKGEHVWAVLISHDKPIERMVEREYTLSLGQGWKNRLPGLLHHLSRFRE